MNRSRTLFAALAGGFAAAAAAAAEGGEPGGVFAGDVGNALWTLVIFGLVVFVLGKFAWKPILKGLSEREAFIRTSLEQAKKDREEAAARLREYGEKLDQARQEASAIVEEARRDADEVKRRLQEEAQQEGRQIVERARREVEIASETAKKQLFTLATDLATGVAGRILERELRPEDHRRLIDQAITEIDRSGQ